MIVLAKALGHRERITQLMPLVENGVVYPHRQFARLTCGHVVPASIYDFVNDPRWCSACNEPRHAFVDRIVAQINARTEAP